MLANVNYHKPVAKVFNADDLIASTEVAVIIGLSNRKGVSVYRGRHVDFPAPVVDKGKCVLWLRADVERWAKARR